VTAAAAAAGVAALGAAGLLHFALARLSRRIPLWLARRRGERARAAPRPRPLALLVLALQASVWLAAAWLATEPFPVLRASRATAGDLLLRSLRMPLFTLDERSYAALDLLVLPALVAAVWLAVSGITRLVRSQVLAAAGFDASAQETLSVLLRYALAFLGTLVVLQAWGVDLRSLAILASVVGVGIGFGLQNIANNFVSGLLINLERPIRPGDFVHVGEFAGTVQSVGARSTSIRTLDQVSILVPNARFLETEVVNWSHGDPLSRVHVPVGVEYGSDVARVRHALLSAAREHRAVLREPRPRVQFLGFGQSSLDFELLVWTRDPRNQQALVSDLNFRIEEGLRRAGLRVPFPQQDLHLRWPTLERVVESWARTHLPDAVLAEGGSPEPLPLEGSEEDPAERGPEDWSDDEVRAWAERMRGPQGVPVEDRRWLLSVHRACFVGSEAVDWLVRAAGLTRPEATAVGGRMVGLGLVRHVLDEHGFHDGRLYYRFAEAPRVTRAAAPASERLGRIA
jgi:small-conductance mechanosensitive channel